MAFVIGLNLIENEYGVAGTRYLSWTQGDQLSSPPKPMCLWSRCTCITNIRIKHPMIKNREKENEEYDSVLRHPEDDQVRICDPI